MKSFIWTFTLLILFSCAGQRASESSLVVPERVQTAFRSVYPEMEADWTREGKLLTVEFEENGIRKKWIYAPDGTIAASESEILIRSLFPSVLSYVHANYGEYAVQAAFIGERRAGRYYALELDSDRKQGLELIFDADGNFVEERTVQQP